MNLTKPLVIVLAAFVALAAPSHAELAISQATDKSVDVKTGVYTARVDAKGNLVDLTIKGAKSLTQQFGPPRQPPATPPTITLTGEKVLVESGDMRVEWTFGEDQVGVLTEGFSFECQIDPSVKAVVAPVGNGEFAARPANVVSGGSSALVLANDMTVSYEVPFHAGGGRFVPTGYCNGMLPAGNSLEFSLILGQPADTSLLKGN